MKSKILATLSLLCVASLCLIVISLRTPTRDIKHNEVGMPVKEDDVDDADIVLTSAINSPLHQVEFFRFDPSDFSSPLPSFGTTDKLLVHTDVMATYGDQLADFEFIGSRINDRVQYLSNLGIQLTTPNRKWHTYIYQAEVVGGNVRVAVNASVGADVAMNGGRRMGVEQEIYEIWKLDLNGNSPVLLERSEEFFTGVATHAEVPVDPLTWPAGIQMGVPQ